MLDTRGLLPLTWAALTMLFWGAAPILEKVGLAKIAPLPATALRSWMIGAVLLGVITAAGRWKEIVCVDLRSLGVLLAGGFLAGLLGQVTYFAALRGGEASRIVPFVAAFPVVTVLLALLIFRESFDLSKAAGTLLVITGVLILRLSA